VEPANVQDLKVARQGLQLRAEIVFFVRGLKVVYVSVRDDPRSPFFIFTRSARWSCRANESLCGGGRPVEGDTWRRERARLFWIWIA
jgi:hypothetical protein